MKKKFAFLGFHVIEDHKFTGSRDTEEFFRNPVMLKTDRFLEKDLREKMQLGIKRPYTFVIDTAGCNKNCWFCYAYPIVKKESYDKCKTIFLSPEELVKCFSDKISNLKEGVILKDRFFSKLRITGGEPLFSTKDTLTEIEGENYSYKAIEYFLEFFKLLDPEIKRLLEKKILFLSTPKKYSDKIPFPTFLSTDDNRIEIRFDTNGFLFSDKENGLNFTERFVEGVYSLFESGKLNNLLIKIDYSLKGVYPFEVSWSQNERLPINKDEIKDFKIEDHPQYFGLKNIFDLITKYNKKNNNFRKCFDITIEPGINNVKRNSMYYENSLNWKLLEKKLREKFGDSFKLSDVDNKMEVRGKIHTHLKRGVAIKVKFDEKEFICLPTDSKEKKKELFTLIRKLREENKNFIIVYIPQKKNSE